MILKTGWEEFLRNLYLALDEFASEEDEDMEDLPIIRLIDELLKISGEEGEDED